MHATGDHGHTLVPITRDLEDDSKSENVQESQQENATFTVATDVKLPRQSDRAVESGSLPGDFCQKRRPSFAMTRSSQVVVFERTHGSEADHTAKQTLEFWATGEHCSHTQGQKPGAHQLVHGNLVFVLMRSISRLVIREREQSLAETFTVVDPDCQSFAGRDIFGDGCGSSCFTLITLAFTGQDVKIHEGVLHCR